MTKKILVTGSHGFIGHALCKRIRRDRPEYALFTLDRAGSGPNHSKIDINSEEVGSVFESVRPDTVVHLAGNVSVKFSLENPKVDFQINAMGTLAVLLNAIQANCHNFLYVTSGGAIYDSHSSLPLREQSPEKPSSPYGLSKLMGEHYLRILANGKMNWTSLALSNCYGQVTEQNNGVIHSFWKTLSSGATPTIHGRTVSRDFIFIDDVLDAIMIAIENPLNQRVHISSGKSTAILEVLSKMQNILGTNVTPNIQDTVPGTVETNCLDNSLAFELWGWRPKIDLETGLPLSLLSVGK